MKEMLAVMATALLLTAGASLAADFNGDGTGDIAIFRESSGLWSVRDLTRFYFGTVGDLPQPSDWDGNGTDLATIFRPARGLWAIRGLSRIYFGGSGDEPEPGDYNGDGTEDIGIFRESSGLWAALGITRIYFGVAGDRAIAPDVARGASRGGGLLKTGQFTSYSSGDDGTYQSGTAFSYQTDDPADNGEMVTIDNVTGLMWASDGNGAGCFNGQTATWFDALEYCNDLAFAEFSDWRLPNVRELQSIADYGTYGPSLNAGYFPNSGYNYYWSSTSTPSYPSAQAFVVNFYHGAVWNYSKTDGYWFRAVRGGQALGCDVVPFQLPSRKLGLQHIGPSAGTQSRLTP